LVLVNGRATALIRAVSTGYQSEKHSDIIVAPGFGMEIMVLMYPSVVLLYHTHKRLV